MRRARFVGNLEQFAGARGDRPYILLAPEVLSCGARRSRTRDHYTYSKAEWDSLQGGDDFAFEDDGLAAVLADVAADWHGEPRAFLTGWEAGGHTVWAQTFRHPERWRGVAPVTTNYQRRGVTAASVLARARERTSLPIQPFRCGAPTGDDARPRDVGRRPADRSSVARRARARVRARSRCGWSRGRSTGRCPRPCSAWCDSLRRR